MLSLILPALSVFAASVAAHPTADDPATVAPQAPWITASPVDNTKVDATRTYRHRRDILSDVGQDVNSILGALGSDIPSFVASGVPDYFAGLPTGDAVKSSLGLDDSQIAALPTQVLNLPPYANWTKEGWSVRFHGNVYKQPNTSTEELNRLASGFLVGTNFSSLSQDEQAQSRNVTAEIFVLQQGDVTVSRIHLEPMQEQGGTGQSSSGGAQDITLPYNTTKEGDSMSLCQSLAMASWLGTPLSRSNDSARMSEAQRLGTPRHTSSRKKD